MAASRAVLMAGLMVGLMEPKLVVLMAASLADLKECRLAEMWVARMVAWLADL